MQVKILTLIFILLAFASCDPLRRIVVKNESTEKATITFKLKEDSALHSPVFINNSEKVSYTITNLSPHNKMRLSFGSGNWTHGAIKNLADDLDYLEIESTAGNQKLASEEEIITFLKEHLKGILRKNIHINIK